MRNRSAQRSLHSEPMEVRDGVRARVEDGAVLIDLHEAIGQARGAVPYAGGRVLEGELAGRHHMRERPGDLLVVLVNLGRDHIGFVRRDDVQHGDDPAIGSHRA